MSNLVFALLFLLTALSVQADSLKFTRVTGGPPLPGVSDAKTDLGVVQGDEFKKIKTQVQKIIVALQKHKLWTPEKAILWDVGPDGGYISAVIELKGKTYTINSWYPLYRQSLNTAVSETQGLVDVKSKNEKQDVEARNSETYKQIVAIFDLMPRRQQR
jgi:hypothetical protein